MKKQISHVFWDWNGTLLDDVGAALDSVNDMLAVRGLSPISLEVYRRCVDTPIIRFYEQLFDMENEDYPALLAGYNEGYEKHLAERGLSYGALHTLEMLRESGARQIVVSSCEQTQLDKYVALYGTAPYFDAVLGAGNFLAESKVGRALSYMQAQAIDGGAVLVIGDLAGDFEMAQRLGASCILLNTGHHPAADLARCGVPVAGSFEEIDRLLKTNYRFAAP